MNYTNEEQDRIIEMYKANSNIDEIIEYFNSTEHDIRKVLKERCIDRKYNCFSDELYDRIVYLYQKKYVQEKICYDLLISTTGIKNTLKRKGIPLRSASERNQKYNRNQHYFDKIDTPNKAYILGLIYSDGCNHVNHNSIVISLQEQDIDILNRIKKELEYDGPIRINSLSEKNPRHKNQFILNINDEYMSKKLVELGVVNAKSLILKFPDFLDEHLVSHFVRGYFDGDGNIYYDSKRNKCSTQTVGTWNFCKTLSDILLKFNCKNSIKHPKICNENTFIIQTSGNKSSLSFLSWIYENADMKLDRKYHQYLSFSNCYSTK